MWHSASIMGFIRLNDEAAGALTRDLISINQDLWANTKSYFPEKFFIEHFLKETILNASDVEDVAPNYVKVIFKTKGVFKDGKRPDTKVRTNGHPKGTGSPQSTDKGTPRPSPQKH